MEKIGKPIGGAHVSASDPHLRVETARVRGLQFVILDLFAEENKRNEYRSFFCNTRGIILVIDATAASSYTEASKTIKDVFDDDELFGIPLLIFWNKADQVDEIEETDVVSGLKLDDMHGLEYSVHIIAAAEPSYDTAFYEGLNWLAEQVEVDDELNRAREPFTI